MKPILAFDVNETLLDLKTLDPIFEKIFGDSSMRQLWFSQFLHNAFVSIITDSYQKFESIGMSALVMVAAKKGIRLKKIDKSTVMNAIYHLPPHPEVLKALKSLKEAGFYMVTLTNWTQKTGRTQIKSAGLESYFEDIISADAVKKLKPSREPYQFAAKKLNTKTKDMILIAAHAWDITGALNAGLMAAFISRPGAVLDPLVKRPNIIGENMQDVADKIIAYYI